MNWIPSVRRSIVLGSLLSISGFLSTASAEETDEPGEGLRDRLAEICRQNDLPAMAVAVVNSDGLVEADCVGVRKRGSASEVELSDRFPIGSNSKSMTGTLAAVLVDAGKIQWTTTIDDVWPSTAGMNVHPDLKKVTLDQLLSHQSGLAANVSDLSEQAWADFFAEQEAPIAERKRLLKLALSQPPSQPQGSFGYSNLGYAVASAMLENRGGEPFEVLMKKHLFDPLEMDTADFRSMKSAKKLQPPMLWGHRADSGEPIDPRMAGAENPTIYAAAGTIHVAIEDYAKYARWQLSGDPSPVLQSQSAMDHLRKPQVAYATDGAEYGSGWIILKTGLGQALTHTGSNTNTLALIWIFPESNFAAIVCTNSGQSEAFPACDEMIRYLMTEHAAVSRAPEAD
ncbi:serine hydrolase domain-containing protein [Allorhodopirellula solitaria]|uniref:D-alanyl-D-alanine carboxypeptidase n=1 Tax=Allorhodopirellula solitaria TaxID=2527987 RepID=A0A5C5WYX5_9BACT|nr:serine hydrolase domain-containing protein [Allorhodopirellula solitaria]TWT55917.1 D-alanyl-D-alanine carboxypeptidase precursor [Allorhodopirellula solitaria]